MENEKNDEETREPSFQKDMSSLIKDNLDDKDQVKNTQSCIEKEENVAENVEGGFIILKTTITSIPRPIVKMTTASTLILNL
jgi:hypothetical protein